MISLKGDFKKLGSKVKKLEPFIKDSTKIKKFKLPISLKGTPPADMDPLTDDKWWDICRDETAEGIDHDGIYPGCYECYTLCASHPASSEAQDTVTCLEKTINNCVLPEIADLYQKYMDYINPPDSCSWKQFDSNTWESESCRDPQACSNECQRHCVEEGFNTGQCETAGDIYYCNCS